MIGTRQLIEETARVGCRGSATVEGDGFVVGISVRGAYPSDLKTIGTTAKNAKPRSESFTKSFTPSSTRYAKLFMNEALLPSDDRHVYRRDKCTKLARSAELMKLL